MPTRPTGVADTAEGVGVVEIDLVERASEDLVTTTTADPGTTGTTLAVTAGTAARLGTASNVKLEIIGTSGLAERVLATGGVGTTSITIVRAQDFTGTTPGTTGFAHSVGAKVARVVGVQRVHPVDAGKQVSFRGRATTFRTPGRAGTTGQKIFTLHNASGSPVLVDVHNIKVDQVQTVVKAATVLPPLIRIYRFTALPTNGTALTKNTEDTLLASRTAVTALGDASADGTVSAVALTQAAITNGTQTGLLEEEFAPRFMGGAGTNPQAELADRIGFFQGEDEIITLRALEGIAVHLDYTLATQNPITDMYTVTCRWFEYTQA